MIVAPQTGYAADLLKIEAPNTTGTFFVTAYDRRAEISHIVQKSGPYSGVTKLPSEAIVLVVKATGPWRATITAK